MANQFYFSVWKLFTSLRLWMNKDDVNLWDPKSRTGKIPIHCHLSVPQTPFWVILCHAITEKTKSKLCTVTRTWLHILHTVLVPCGAVYRSSPCPSALLSREGEMQSESTKLHVPACSAQNGSSAVSVREPRCFFYFSQLFFQFWSHFPPLSCGKSFAATYQQQMRGREVEGIFRYI